MKQAGLPHIRLHGFQHTCASLLFRKNVHPKLVQELLGHASVAITLDTYSDMLPVMGGEAADAMGTYSHVMPGMKDQKTVVATRGVILQRACLYGRTTGSDRPSVSERRNRPFFVPTQ